MKARKPKLVGAALVIVGLGLSCVGIRFLIRPTLYEAKTRVSFGKVRPFSTRCLPIEFDFIESSEAAAKIIPAATNITKPEPRRQHHDTNGHGSKVEDLIQNHRLKFSFVRNETNEEIYEIHVLDKSPIEAARLADAIAEEHRDWWIESSKHRAGEEIKSYEQRFAEQRGRMIALQKKMDSVKKELGVPDNATEAALRDNYALFWQAKWDFEAGEAFLNVISNKTESAKSDAMFGWQPPIPIIVRAQVPASSVWPNRPIGSVMLLCGFGLSAIGIRRLVRK